jgi:Tfp pilus assembly ATPase PilU
MQTMNDALYNLYINKTVALEEVLRASHDQAELMRMIGITQEEQNGNGAKNGAGTPAMAKR